MTVTAYHSDGRKAFSSQNLRGLISYGSKHAASVDLGECVTHAGLYHVKYADGVWCRGSFADPSVMLGLFLNRPWVTEIDCERTVFNRGACLGRYTLGPLLDIGRTGSARVGLWTATAYRDDYQTPMVRFTR